MLAHAYRIQASVQLQVPSFLDHPPRTSSQNARNSNSLTGCRLKSFDVEDTAWTRHTAAMQGPRLPSHAAGRQITLQRLEVPPKRDDGQREDNGSREGQAPDDGRQGDAASTPSPPLLDNIAVIDTGGGSSREQARDEEDGSSSADTCSRRSSRKTRLNKTITWGRRHLRFIGPGLSGSFLLSLLCKLD